VTAVQVLKKAGVDVSKHSSAVGSAKADWKTYPSYKPSGIEWLRDVPEHWVSQKVRFGFSVQLGKMLQPEATSENDCELPYLKAQHVQWNRVRVDELPTMWATDAESQKYGVMDGDLLVCEGGEVGRGGIVRNPSERTIIQNALHRVRPRHGNETRFLLYVLYHASSQHWFEIL